MQLHTYLYTCYLMCKMVHDQLNVLIVLFHSNDHSVESLLPTPTIA